MLNVLALVGILGVATAQRGVLLSAKDEHVAFSESSAMTFTIDVTFQACPGADLSETLSTAVAFSSDVQVQPNGCSLAGPDIFQVYSCRFTLIRPPSDNHFTAFIPGNDVDLYDSSNSITFEYISKLEMDLYYKYQNADSGSLGPATLLLHSTVDIIPVYTNPVDAIVCDGYTTLAITYTSPRDWEIIIDLSSTEKTNVDCRINAGVVTNVLGNLNTEQQFNTLLDVVGQLSDCVYGEWEAPRDCPCLRFESDFSMRTGTETRTTDKPDSCTDTTRTADCSQFVSDYCTFENTFRPFAGETGNECQKIADGSCTPVDPRFPTAVTRALFQEQAGCYCDAACVVSGDCCQGFFERDCGGTAAQRAELYDADWEPFTCTACTSPAQIRGEAGTKMENSYGCGCDEESFNNNLFCGGRAAASICF